MKTLKTSHRVRLVTERGNEEFTSFFSAACAVVCLARWRYYICEDNKDAFILLIHALRFNGWSRKLQ